MEEGCDIVNDLPYDRWTKYIMFEKYIFEDRGKPMEYATLYYKNNYRIRVNHFRLLEVLKTENILVKIEIANAEILLNFIEICKPKFDGHLEIEFFESGLRIYTALLSSVLKKEKVKSMVLEGVSAYIPLCLYKQNVIYFDYEYVTYTMYKRDGLVIVTSDDREAMGSGYYYYNKKTLASLETIDRIILEEWGRFGGRITGPEYSGLENGGATRLCVCGLATIENKRLGYEISEAELLGEYYIRLHDELEHYFFTMIV